MSLKLSKCLLQVVPDGAAQLLADTELLCHTIMDCTVLGESNQWGPLRWFWGQNGGFEQKFMFCSAFEKNHIIE